MKFIQRFFITLILFVFCIFNVVAKDPPPPQARTTNVPPPAPGLSVDENINIMMALALLFGIYIIYSFRLKQKTPN